jgi:endoglucanase
MTKHQLVYSTHEYGPEAFAQPWFNESNMAATLNQRWQAGFGYIHDRGIAPALVGEFGAQQVSTDTVKGCWFTQFTDYLAQTDISWTFWAWNPNSGDTGGILQDDLLTINQAKMNELTDLVRSQKATTTRRH